MSNFAAEPPSRQVVWQRAAKARGLCPCCAKPRHPSYIRCESCQNKHVAWAGTKRPFLRLKIQALIETVADALGQAGSSHFVTHAELSTHLNTLRNHLKARNIRISVRTEPNGVWIFRGQ